MCWIRNIKSNDKLKAKIEWFHCDFFSQYEEEERQLRFRDYSIVRDDYRYLLEHTNIVKDLDELIKLQQEYDTKYKPEKQNLKQINDLNSMIELQKGHISDLNDNKMELFKLLDTLNVDDNDKCRIFDMMKG